jgi:hypothetical protein
MTAPHAAGTSRRRAPTWRWHLAVLLAVLVVPVLLLGWPSWNAQHRQDPIATTRVVIRTLSAAIAAYQVRTWSWQAEDPLTRLPVAHREALWDLNHDGVLDGRPSVQGGPGSDGGFAPDLIASGYQGPVAMLRPVLAKTALNASGQVVDAWGQPLRIRLEAAGAAGAAPGFTLWSLGPDGVEGTGDDIASGAAEPTP